MTTPEPARCPEVSTDGVVELAWAALRTEIAMSRGPSLPADATGSRAVCILDGRECSTVKNTAPRKPQGPIPGGWVNNSLTSNSTLAAALHIASETSDTITSVKGKRARTGRKACPPTKRCSLANDTFYTPQFRSSR